MADKRKPRTRFEMIMQYLRSLRDSEKETPKKKKKGEKSILELINFGGDYEERSEGGVLVGEDTGKKTQAGRTVYKTPEGEMVSEKSTTFKYKGKWINIPSIVMGVKLEDHELKKLLDEGLIKPTSTHDNLEDAEKAAQERSDSLEYNKGGTPMDEQMKMFGEGGLLDEGGEVDEESGNEVPIGGTKEGVRDDIPAMLSEGEFVFPEDVTRYHGLEKLMTLRQEAKMGLKKMEAMGQMGNSEEATIPDDLPFTMDDLLVVVTGEKEESKKKDDEPIKAQAGTFVPATEQQSNMGIMGFQQSMYGQQGAQNPVAVAPQIPASSVAPTVQMPPQGGFTAPTVPATPVNQPEFVPDVSDIYKPVKYINPTTGETMTINEYQGNPVSAVPVGFIRYDDYIASGGKDPNEDTNIGTAVETTSVETAQVAGAQDDERKENIASLQKMRDEREKERIKEYNKVFNLDYINIDNPEDENFISNERLIDAYKDQLEGETIGAAMTPVVPLAGLLPRFNRGQVNKAMEARFGANFKELPEFKDITRGSALKDAAAEIGKDFKKTFTAEGRDIFYKEYEAKYDVADDSFKKKFGGAGTGYTVLEKDEKGQTTKATGALSVREQQSFDNAVDRGDNAVADHFALVAYHRSAKDQFAKNNADLIEQANSSDPEVANAAKGKLYGGSKEAGGVRFSNSTIEEIIKYGGSSTTAVNEGRAVKQKGFKQPRVVTDDKPAGSQASDKTSSSCVIATHAVASGAFHKSDKANAIDWCKKNLHDKWWGETMRKGYRYLGRKHIANGTAETVYKEFKECIEWANGKRDFTFKIAARYYYRVAQTFIVGLFVKEDI